MRIKRGKDYAVLTGDIVQSSRLTVAERRKLNSALKNIEAQLATWSDIVLPMSRYRGDGWQVLMTAPNQSLRLALFIRAALRLQFHGKRVDTRIAIGIGPVDFVPDNRVAEGDGAAYRRSGSALEEKGWRRLRFRRIEEHETVAGRQVADTDVQVVLDLVDTVARGWTPAQAQAVVGALLGWTQEHIAARWRDEPITQQGVAQHLARAGWDAVEVALTWYDQKLQVS